MFLYEFIHDASLLPDSKIAFTHVSVLMVYTHPRSVTTSCLVCMFTHNPARISKVYRRANSLVFDLVQSPLFLILPMMLSSAYMLSGAAVVNIANAVT